MQTLKLVDGDLLLANSGFATVTGGAKVQQDLQLAMAERYGSDPYHSRWGSLLHRYIGNALDQLSAYAVQREVARVVSNYIAVQTANIQSDILRYDRSGYSTADVVRSIVSIDVTQDVGAPTQLKVRVTVSTADGGTTTLDAQVGAVTAA